jgi:hypothetical protein
MTMYSVLRDGRQRAGDSFHPDQARVKLCNKKGAGYWALARSDPEKRVSDSHTSALEDQTAERAELR